MGNTLDRLGNQPFRAHTSHLLNYPAKLFLTRPLFHIRVETLDGPPLFTLIVPGTFPQPTR